MTTDSDRLHRLCQWCMTRRKDSTKLCRTMLYYCFQSVDMQGLFKLELGCGIVKWYTYLLCLQRRRIESVIADQAPFPPPIAEQTGNAVQWDHAEGIPVLQLCCPVWLHSWCVCVCQVACSSVPLEGIREQSCRHPPVSSLERRQGSFIGDHEQQRQ